MTLVDLIAEQTRLLCWLHWFDERSTADAIAAFDAAGWAKQPYGRNGVLLERSDDDWITLPISKELVDYVRSICGAAVQLSRSGLTPAALSDEANERIPPIAC